VDFQETLAGEEFAEQRAHSRLDAEDGVVGLRLRSQQQKVSNKVNEENKQITNKKITKIKQDISEFF
jgi:anti-sigma28 factor (negative regulator of flagellin synthesis)